MPHPQSFTVITRQASTRLAIAGRFAEHRRLRQGFEIERRRDG